MRVAVKDLKSNPFKPDLPLNEIKIAQLEASIKKTGHWKNVIQAREVKDGYEIAFGHHRLQALKNLGIKAIEVTIIDPDDDDTMLQMMAGENADEWGLRAPTWIMEVVKVAFNRLKERGNLLYIVVEQNQDWGIANKIADYLAWPLRRVTEAYANLRATGEIESISEKDTKEPPSIPKEIFKQLPTQAHATEFRKAVSRTGASHKVQKETLKDILKPEPGKKTPKAAEKITDLMEEKQIKLGEKPKRKKTEIEPRGDALIYRNKLMKVINILPYEPPKELKEEEFIILKALALTIIKRLRRFENG